MRTPESIVKKALKRELDECGAYHFWPVQTGYGQATLDCFACMPENTCNPFGHPCFWGIECKREGLTEPTPRQAEIMRRIRQAGGRTWVVTMEEGRLKWVEITS